MCGICCIGEAACCAGAAFCGVCCKLCGCCGVNSKNFAKIGFVFFQICWIMVGVVVMYTAKDLVDWLPSFMDCPDESYVGNDQDGSACLGASAIIRMSFVLAVFHVFVFLIILMRNTAAAAFHDGCWLVKSLAVFAGFIVSMWIPVEFF